MPNPQKVGLEVFLLMFNFKIIIIKISLLIKNNTFLLKDNKAVKAMLINRKS